jgi:regulatory protein
MGDVEERSRPNHRPRGGRSGTDRPSFSERRAAKAEIEDVSIVLDAAARFLEARQRSVAETRRRLRTAGYRDDLIEAALARLVELRYLDDETFARSWVESRDRARPRGELALRRELAQKGVGRELAASILEERRSAAEESGPEAGSPGGSTSPDEVAARRLLERRARQIGASDDPRVRRQRAYALLARNGFDPDVCRRIAAAWVEPADEDEAPPDDRV